MGKTTASGRGRASRPELERLELLLKVLLQGSNALAEAVARRLLIDARADPSGVGEEAPPEWSDLAQWAVAEAVLTHREADRLHSLSKASGRGASATRSARRKAR
jgi:hypothetical protein